MKFLTWKNLVYGAVFASIFAYVGAFGSAVLIPRVAPETAGRLICSGRIEYVSFKQTYFCFMSNTDFFNMGDMMFWAVFWRALWFSIPISFIATFGVMNLMTVVYRRREAAGF